MLYGENDFAGSAAVGLPYVDVCGGSRSQKGAEGRAIGRGLPCTGGRFTVIGLENDSHVPSRWLRQAHLHAELLAPTRPNGVWLGSLLRPRETRVSLHLAYVFRSSRPPDPALASSTRFNSASSWRSATVADNASPRPVCPGSTRLIHLDLSSSIGRIGQRRLAWLFFFLLIVLTIVLTFHHQTREPLLHRLSRTPAGKT